MNGSMQVLFSLLMFGTLFVSQATSYKNKNGWRHKKAVLADIIRYKRMLDGCNHYPMSFVCGLSHGSLDLRCIPITQRCDGHLDCPYGDDEDGCQPCSDGDICCTDGGCATVCDGTHQCVNGEDELGCPSHAEPVPLGHVRCPSGNIATICDGIVECNQEYDCKDDESHCRTSCSAGNVVCDTIGMCGIPCDHSSECPNKEDDTECYIDCDPSEVDCLSSNNGLPICAEMCGLSSNCVNRMDFKEEYCGNDCRQIGDCERIYT